MNRLLMIVLMILIGGMAEIVDAEGKSAVPSRRPRFSPRVSPRVSPRASESSESPSEEPAPGSREDGANSDRQADTEKAAAPPPKRVPSLDEMILFQPSRKGNWTPDGIEYTDVEFTSDDGIRLHAWYAAADNPRAVVLYCHGNAGNISWVAEHLEFLRKEHRLSVFAFDYRGYGKSKGVPTVEGVIADGLAARAKCAELAGIESSDVVIWGRSMGGAVAVQLAAADAPRGLILECTFDSFKSVARHHAPTLSALVPADRLASVACMPGITCPLFQIHGTADRVVPYSLGQTLFTAANQPKQFVTLKNYDHNDRPPPKLYTEIDRFIDTKCPAPSSAPGSERQ